MRSWTTARASCGGADWLRPNPKPASSERDDALPLIVPNSTLIVTSVYQGPSESRARAGRPELPSFRPCFPGTRRFDQCALRFVEYSWWQSKHFQHANCKFIFRERYEISFSGSFHLENWATVANVWTNKCENYYFHWIHKIRLELLFEDLLLNISCKDSIKTILIAPRPLLFLNLFKHWIQKKSQFPNIFASLKAKTKLVTISAPDFYYSHQSLPGENSANLSFAR